MLHIHALINIIKRGLVFFMLALALALLLVLGLGGFQPVRAAEIPLQLKQDDIARVDFNRADTFYLPLLPGIEEDREKIARLLELYNQAAANLGPEGSLFADEENMMPFFLPRINISLAGGGSVKVILYRGVSLYADPLIQSRPVADRAAGEKLLGMFWDFFVPAQGVTVNSREPRMGEKVTVSSDYAGGDEAFILLMPSYWPCTFPSAPHPYPVPEAILLATVPVEHGRFSYTFTLTESMGKALGGSPGHVGPGAWELVVTSSAVQTGMPLTILPAQAAPPRAVLYHQGQVFTWSAAAGVQKEPLTNPADQPLLLGDEEWGSPRTHLSLNFLRRLDIPLTMLEAGRFQIGERELGLTVREGEDSARINGTMLSLDGTLQKWGDTWRIPWQRLGYFFDYREQWLGPETVVFLRNLDTIPAALQRETALAKGPAPAGPSVKVTLEGEKLDLGDRQAYLNPRLGRIMVPLRPLAQALGGKPDWFPLQPDYRENAAEHNYGLPPTGERVTARVEVTLEDKRWGTYLLREQRGGITMVPLRTLALALGYKLTWDAARNQVNLELIKEPPSLRKSHAKTYASLDSLLKDLKEHYRAELAKITPDPWEINNLYTVDSKEIDFNGDGEKSRVSFVTLALNEEKLQAGGPDVSGNALLLDPGFFVYQNGTTGMFEYIKIIGNMEFSERDLMIKYEDISGDSIPEIFYEVVVRIPGSVNNANPHILMYNPAAGRFEDLNIAAATDFFIEAWGFEDVSGAGLNKLWIDVKKDLVDDQPVRKYAALAGGRLIFD